MRLVLLFLAFFAFGLSPIMGEESGTGPTDLHTEVSQVPWKYNQNYNIFYDYDVLYLISPKQLQEANYGIQTANSDNNFRACFASWLKNNNYQDLAARYNIFRKFDLSLEKDTSLDRALAYNKHRLISDRYFEDIIAFTIPGSQEHTQPQDKHYLNGETPLYNAVLSIFSMDPTCGAGNVIAAIDPHLQVFLSSSIDDVARFKGMGVSPFYLPSLFIGNFAVTPGGGAGDGSTSFGNTGLSLFVSDQFLSSGMPNWFTVNAINNNNKKNDNNNNDNSSPTPPVIVVVVPATPVPEPGTYLLLGTMLLATCYFIHKRREAKKL